MKAADSSVGIAAFAPWHEHHARARRALRGRPAIVSHAAFEAYSVLTRLPPPERAGAHEVRVFLEDWFADRWLGLTAAAQRLALARLEELGVSGGRTYDGLIAITAASNDATLVTLDRRALPTYLLVGADVELVA
ncbi:PIN domain-containing protein [Gaiella occulta]|uniref:PIN domain-containing protein n=1 Tax=Gaiella occulta TaxID=1002870 RepID=UPI000E0B201B|nr:PIN domain-containing protein [Gaiella occulta]